MVARLVAPAYEIKARSILQNPDQETLHELTARMPNARRTAFGNLNVRARVDARSTASTYIVTDTPALTSSQTLSCAEGARIAALQDAYIAEQDMLVVDGWIGNDPEFRVAARLIIEQANANIAGMQEYLYYTADLPREPQLTVIYTPNLPAPGYPHDRVITVDLERMVTRVLNSDYFGESKKGGLRMWNQLVQQRGGLALHAGCKVIPVGAREKVMLIVGLSGTGKTTTTFTRQNHSKPVQDDFVALLPGGKVYATEDGCFAKTFGLDPRFEPTIYGAVTKPDAYLENVAQHGLQVDFFDTSYTQNGRAVFPMASIDAYDPAKLGTVDDFLILNRNDNLIPAVARLSQAQAAAYFMLGETQGTSAGGKEEMGKALRVPGTNPFFPLLHSAQGNRFLALLRSHPIQVYLLNTGWVGGGDGDPRAKKVGIPHSSAIVKAIAEETIQWTADPDFGYAVATHVPGIAEEDLDLLQPRRRYAAQGRLDEYAAIVTKLKREREANLRGWPGLEDEIIQAIL
jgi:phosphoenolpyruvate carboxykinase (ATP)